MRKDAVLRWFTGAFLAVAFVACSSSVAAPASTGTPAPSTPVTATSSSSATAASAVTPTAAVSLVDAPAILDVACDGTRTTLAAAVVMAQADGVHIRFTNSSGQELPYQIEDVGGASIPIDGGSVIHAIAPGPYELSCATDLVAFRVADPGGLYVVADCAESGSETTGASDFVQGAMGMHGALLEVARRQLHGLKPGDVVERAGYAKAGSDQRVRVVRRGDVLAILAYADDGAGGWLLGGTRMCAGSDLAIVTTGG